MLSNTVKFNVKIEPAIQCLKGVNFSTAFTCNLSGANLSYSYDNAGNLVVNAAYNQTIQNENITLFFTPPADNPQFASTPTSSLSFIVDPNNNLAAVYYSDDVYNSAELYEKLSTVVMYLSLMVFVMGVAIGKFIGVEMMGVVQISYIGLMIINYLHPVLAPFSKISFVNGFNNLFTSSSTNSIPNRITALNYQGELAYNLNCTTALLLLPPIIALILFITSKIYKKHQ